MADENYTGHEYFCPICKTFFIATGELLDYVYLKHENGEELEIVTVECFSCGTMSIPEGMNQISWLKEEMDLGELK